MSEQARVEIIAIGSELLLGDVQDTNTNWLCQRITGVGGQVTRAAMVRDEIGAIAAEIRSALNRRPGLIITTGGLGPTGDDITMQGVAVATARPVELHGEALAMVKARYQYLAENGYLKDPTLTDARKKMACLPRGASALGNPVGTAPAAVLEIGATTLVSLPGVPEEMKGIYEDTLQPTLKRLFGDSYYEEKRVIALCGDESSLAPVLAKVVEAHPDVYIKSRARRYGAGIRILITLSLAGQGREGVEASLAAALEALTRGLAAAGFELEDRAQE
ncbi:MAG TPA: molybdopterin-binding protein [Anaerolineae bacterium]|nr:molybdopterin-binding protein [Anaerolineae bacterium]